MQINSMGDPNMKLTEGYVLRNIKGNKYLLPIGQNVALHRRGIQLNDTGVFLWKGLQQGYNEKELLSLLIEHYHADSTAAPILESDINIFIKQLISLNILTSDVLIAPCKHYFNIANIMIAYNGPDNLLKPSLLDFSCKEAPVDQHWTINTTPPFNLPNGDLLIKTNEVEIFRSNEEYTITFFPISQLLRTTISLDGTHACFYCIPTLNDSLSEQLFHAFRFVYLIYAQMKGCFALHSSSILYNGKAWLFSGASKTGKSTHTNLWNTQFQTPFINGDLNLIRIHNNQALIYGLPWCGTSDIYSTKAYPLGGITILKQHITNTIENLSEPEKQLMLLQRLISPTWTEEMLDFNIHFTNQLSVLVPIFHLLCTKDPSAVALMKQEIDNISLK